MSAVAPSGGIEEDTKSGGILLISPTSASALHFLMIMLSTPVYDSPLKRFKKKAEGSKGHICNKVLDLTS